MKTFTINFPDNVNLDDREVRTLFASSLYEKGKLSLGHAAELAGYSKRVFIELLGDFGVSVFNYPANDLEKDLKNAENYNR